MYFNRIQNPKAESADIEDMQLPTAQRQTGSRDIGGGGLRELASILSVISPESLNALNP